MTYPSKIDDWKLFEKSNPTITLNALYIKERDMHPAYITKINSNCEKQIIFLMIPNEALFSGKKNLSALIYGITSNHKGHLYCLNCLHSFRFYKL